ncbi:Ubiquitin-conjugating enzyme/RWD-like protein [Corchorus capsularis]|uniref:Ubiquitin-conjugating enzyme/RWD-like protein n=1 Tax=Corchorus capsularis TaxID=210143 RepID=A0A1R3HVZ8_COCAP|nr:Ubiquitin-conjugating enzyme/RWD-like protein [Corchorus capsularis]
MDDTEPVHSIKDVTVVDRGFLHGDYVAAASDSTGQVGVVVDVHISVDLLAPDGSTIKDVSTRGLQRVRDFTIGDYVVLGPWLGRVDDVLDNVNVLFDDGSVCKVTRAEPLRLKPITRNTLEDDSNFPYYPGQRVKASSSSVYKNSRFLSGLWKANRLEGTVTKVTAGSVFIYWIASAGYGPDSSTAPAEEQNPKNLKLLSCFAHANWQVGDWCLLPIMSRSSPLDKGLAKLQLDSEEVTLDESNDISESIDLDAMPTPDDNNANTAIGTKASSESSSCSFSVHYHRKKMRKVVLKKDKKAKKKVENFERALLIVNSRTRVDVAWQDGTIDHGVDATTLIPIETPGDHEFVAEQYVVEKSSDDDDTYEPRRVGVVRSVNAKERTACVRWLKPVVRAEDPREFDKEEIVSVYELEGHPDYDYCYGDVVVRLSPASVPTQYPSGEASIKEPKQEDGSNEVKRDFKKHSGSNKVEDASLNEDTTDFTDLSWVGNITGLRNGDIEVTWADGMVSTVGPQAVYVVGRDDDESIAAGSEVSDDAASWETVNDDEMDALENAQEDLEPQNASSIISEVEEGMENNSGRNAALSLPLAAIDFVTRLASGLFSGRRKNVLDSEGENELQNEGQDSNYESSSQKSNALDDSVGESIHENREEHDEAKACEQSLTTESLSNLTIEDLDAKTGDEDDVCSFKRFDTAKDPLDHYFLGSNGQSNAGRKWLKKVQQDWNILQNNLPGEGEKNSLAYNENTFLLNCKSMMYLMRKPPKDFEELVREHFRRRGYYILKACDAYMKGYLIGSLTRDASSSDADNANSTSVGFKLMLGKIVPKLLLSLKEVGADTNEFNHLQQS